MTTTPTSRVPLPELLELAGDVLTAAGMRPVDADLLARSLVEADATGVHTHGLSRLTPYVAQLRSGQVNAAPREKVLAETPGALLVDADRGFGAPVGVRAVEQAMGKARTTGVALAGVTRVAHFGAAGFFTRQAAQQGFLAFAMSSSSPSVVPFGGRGPRIGNSPMSFAAPGEQGPELVADMAQSMSSRGRIKLARDAGTALPEGWAVDAEGRPTTDPARALGGGVLTSGGHKGSAMSLVVEMLASGLTGANLSQHVALSGFTGASANAGRSDLDVTVGNFYLVIDADLFGDATGVRDRATRIARHVRASEPAAGVEQVYAPGDIEAGHLERARREGVPVAETTLRELADLAAGLKDPRPTPHSGVQQQGEQP
jgi:LDH2 family malate/lactate/ureidoglycolate dehydrogenase